MAKSKSTVSREEHARRRAQSINDKQLLLSGQQVETLTGLPYRTVYDMHVRGLLPAVRFPTANKDAKRSRLWFRRSDVERLIANSITANAAFAGAR